jgi:hypothetical protein
VGSMRRWPLPLLLTLLALTMLAAPATAAPVLRPGDLLVADPNEARVLHVDPGTGAVEAFSPRPGSGANLLQQPNGIAIDPAGSVFVIDSGAARMFRIDPDTGAQSEVRSQAGFLDLGPLDVGSEPQGLAISGATGALVRPDLFFSHPERLYRVARSAFGATSSLVLKEDALLAGSFDWIAIRESGSVLAEAFVSGAAGLLRFDAGSGVVSPILGASAGTGGVDHSPEVPDRVFFAQDALAAGGAGVYSFTLPSGPIEPVSTGGLFELPQGLAIANASRIYVISAPSASGEPVPIVRLTRGGNAWSQSIAATLPAGDYAHLAVLAVPEPDAAGGAAALGALGLRLAWRTRRLRRV